MPLYDHICVFTLNWNDELRNHLADVSAAFFEHVKSALHSNVTIRVLLFAKAFKEDWQVVVIVELSDLGLPEEFATLMSMVELDGEIAHVIHSSEIGGRDSSLLHGSSLWW